MSLWTIIDNAIENLSSKSKAEIFVFLDNKCPKQLNLIDDELNSIVSQLDEMINVEGKKSRIVQIQSIQKIIDVILKIDFNQELTKESDFLEQLENQQQKIRELEESIIVKNAELEKMNTLMQNNSEMLDQLVNEQQKNRKLKERIVVKNAEFEKINISMQNNAEILKQLENEQQVNRELKECIDVKNHELQKINALLQKNVELERISTICRNHDMEKLKINNETLKQENESLSKNYHLLESSLKLISQGENLERPFVSKLIPQDEIIRSGESHQTCIYCNDKIESLVTENETLKQQNVSLSKNFVQLQITLKEKITENEKLSDTVTVELKKNKLLNGAIGSKNEKIAQLEQKQSNPFSFMGGPNNGLTKF